MTSTDALAALTDALDWIENAPDDASHVLANVAKAHDALATLTAEGARAVGAAAGRACLCPEEGHYEDCPVLKYPERYRAVAAERARAEEEREEHCCNDPSHMSAEYLAALDRRQP